MICQKSLCAQVTIHFKSSCAASYNLFSVFFDAYVQKIIINLIVKYYTCIIHHTVTFNQFNDTLLNKSISFYKNKKNRIHFRNLIV